MTVKENSQASEPRRVLGPGKDPGEDLTMKSNTSQPTHRHQSLAVCCDPAKTLERSLQ